MKQGVKKDMTGGWGLLVHQSADNQGTHEAGERRPELVAWLQAILWTFSGNHLLCLHVRTGGRSPELVAADPPSWSWEPERGRRVGAAPTLPDSAGQ